MTRGASSRSAVAPLGGAPGAAVVTDRDPVMASSPVARWPRRQFYHGGRVRADRGDYAQVVAVGVGDGDAVARLAQRPVGEQHARFAPVAARRRRHGGEDARPVRDDVIDDRVRLVLTGRAAAPAGSAPRGRTRRTSSNRSTPSRSESTKSQWSPISRSFTSISAGPPPAVDGTRCGTRRT